MSTILRTRDTTQRAANLRRWAHHHPVMTTGAVALVGAVVAGGLVRLWRPNSCNNGHSRRGLFGRIRGTVWRGALGLARALIVTTIVSEGVDESIGEAFADSRIG